MPDIEAKVPQRVKDGFDGPLLRGSNRAIKNHQQIDVRVETHMAPTVATDGHQRVGCLGKLLCREMDTTDDLVESRGVLANGKEPAVGQTGLRDQLVSSRG